MHSERTAPDAGDQMVLHLPKVWREPVPISVPCEVRSGFRIVDEVRSRRGIQTQAQLAEWLKPNLAAEIEQISIPGLNDVVARIEQAITKRERIMIFGDYDCDGETSTAILVEGLRAASSDPTAVIWMVPNREHGYGLQDAYLPEVTDADPQLLITVDCGSNDRGPITQLL
ncbi:MAG TPA: DHH family phosphoesterase, partial [Thermomicrobiales bacterium]|nr:DHH family phosphoesterase [Thermomicrobiales bacterium]